MKIKKSKKANLEKKRGIFFRIGLMISLSFALLAFEWSVSDTNIENISTSQSLAEMEEMVPITEIEKPKEIKPEINKAIEEIQVVDDDEKIDDYEIPDIDIDIEDEIPIDDYNFNDDKVEDVIPFVLVEDKPVFGKGEADLINYLAKNTVYNQEALDAGIKGTVYVQFVIGTNGKVRQVELLRGVHPLLDDEAIKVVRNMPKWKPGKQRGVPVAVTFNVPIKFDYD